MNWRRKKKGCSAISRIKALFNRKRTDSHSKDFEFQKEE